jgi:superfamily II DNA or RNA helicase
MIVLRDYQRLAIDQIDEEFRLNNRRVVLWAQTGAGKTVISSWLIQRALTYKYPVLFIVRGRELVKNISQTLDKYGIDHSINMAGHWRYNQKKIIQVASVDTLRSRDNWPFKDQEPLIILDEAHLDYSPVFAEYPNAYFIGPTGTPFTDMSHYQAVVNPIHGFEIRDMGHLVPEKIYCPHLIDVSAVKKTGGDFNRKQLESVVSDSKIVGDIVSDWLQYGERRPTVVFAVSIEHSLRLKQEFCDRGIRAVQVDAESSEAERDAAKAGLVDGSIEVVVNVNLFSTGWDCPEVSCIVFARPTYSLTLYLQMLGRGLRASPGKENCIVLDNAGNVFRHGGPYRLREVSLEKPAKKKSKPMDQKVCTCEECFFVFDPEENESCPECGWIKPKVVREVKSVAGQLTEYFESEEERAKMLFEMMRKEYYRLEWVRKTKKLKPDFAFHQLKKKYPLEIFKQLVKVTVVPELFLKD